MKKHSWTVLCVLLTTCALSPTVSGAEFVQTNLVSDIPSLAPGQPADPNLINPWGMSFSGTSPFWVSNQGSNTATLYNALASPPSPIKQGLTVTIPTGSLGPPTGPTGQVFNSTTSAFMIPAPGGTTVKATFLFATLQGTLEGWNPGSSGGMNNAEIVATTPGAVYTGLALGSVGTANYLYTANAAGSIQVFDSSFTNVTSTTFGGKFVDPNPVSGFTPYNIQNLGGFLYVTYAAATSTGAPLPGGYVDKFDLGGDFIDRIATDGALNAPWGLAIAPSGFGSFGGDLLVGNLFNSQIDAYNLTTMSLDGSIQVNTGFTSPVGLWALDFGNGTTGNADTLYFTAGVNDQKDGLFGDISFVPEPGPMEQIALGCTIIAVLRKVSRARGKRRG